MGEQWQSVARRDRTAANRARRLPYLPVDRLPEKSWDGFLQYAFLRERATWSNIPADDHLSPLLVDRPAVPGGAPYWGRIARLAPLERVLVLFEEMIERLDRQGLDVTAERAQAADLRRQAAEDPDSETLYLAARQAKRQLFFRDPALAPLERILFAKRHPFLESHNYSEHLDGILEPGGGVYVLHIPRDEQDRFRPDRARIQQLFDGSEGIVREPVSDFDAKTIYFAYRPDKPEVEGWASYWHLYAMEADGSGLRKLTDGPFHDFDAVCLPDGGVAFHSTRCKVRFLCWRPQAYVLYRMEADGTNMRRLSHANLSEWKPSVMQSGRILWTRSEYLDKGADFGHTLWSIRPDGTHPELVFGNNTPNCYSQAHEVPGTQELVCTLMSHGDHQGPIALIDRTKGPFDTEAITNITPDTRPHYQMSRSHHDSFRDPYPISRDHFLVTHNPDNQHNWGLYVIDRYGNRELLYVDPEISSKHPTPLRARPRPPVLPSELDAELAEQGLGQFTVQDVYQGLGSTVARGRAKYLRVSEEVPATLEPLPCGEYRADHPPFTDFYATPVHLVHGPTPSFETRTPNAPLARLRTNHNWPSQVTEIGPGLYRVREGGGWPSYVAKASLGTVPIAEDGSANFLAPAGKVLYFQLLDAEYNELQRMRSVIQLQPGERRSCIGCHDNRHASPPPDAGLALTQPPQNLEPPPWGTEAFDYQRVVQPVLDAHCVRCHDGREAGTVRPARHARCGPRARLVPHADRGRLGPLLRLHLRHAALQGRAALVRHPAKPPVGGAGRRAPRGGFARRGRDAGDQGLDRPELPAVAGLHLPPGPTRPPYGGSPLSLCSHRCCGTDLENPTCQSQPLSDTSNAAFGAGVPACCHVSDAAREPCAGPLFFRRSARRLAGGRGQFSTRYRRTDRAQHRHGADA